MKKIPLFLCFLLVLSTFFACSDNLTEKEDIIALFNDNKAVIEQSVENDDFKKVEKLRGIQAVTVYDNCVEFQCGGAGMGGNTHYYGFFFSADDELTAWNGGVGFPKNKLSKDGKGYRYKEQEGDNEYYVEEIGTHFFYYEAHF